MSTAEKKLKPVATLFHDLENRNWSGEVTFSFYKGNMSKKYKVKNIKYLAEDPLPHKGETA